MRHVHSDMICQPLKIASLHLLKNTGSVPIPSTDNACYEKRHFGSMIPGNIDTGNVTTGIDTDKTPIDIDQGNSSISNNITSNFENCRYSKL